MLLLMAGVTAIGTTYVRILSDQLSAIVAERNEKAELATAMRALHETRYQSLMLASNMHDPFLRDEEVMRFSRMAGEFLQVRDKFLALPLDEAEVDLWSRIRSGVQRVEASAEQAIHLLRADRLEEARSLVRHKLLPTQEAMMDEWSKLVAMQRAKNQTAMAEARLASSKARQLTLALSASAFVVGLIIAVFVVRLSRRLEKDLFEEKERAQITLHAIDDAVARFDQDKRICYLNPVAERLLGMTAGMAVGQSMASVLRLFAKNSRDDLTTPLLVDTLGGAHASLPDSACLLSVPGLEYEVEGSCAPIHSPEGEILGGVLVLRDVTEAREMQRRLLWQAEHDSLTHLMNRHVFEERLSRSLDSKRSGDFPMSLLYVDLDHFKSINDAAGHAAGDELLRQIGHLMQSRIRDTDILARMGGNEFAVVLKACPEGKAENIAQDIQARINSFRFQWEGNAFDVGASIGVVHVPAHWTTLDECLAAVDAACYKAKQNGHGKVVVHRQIEGSS